MAPHCMHSCSLLSQAPKVDELKQALANMISNIVIKQKYVMGIIDCCFVIHVEASIQHFSRVNEIVRTNFMSQWSPV